MRPDLNPILRFLLPSLEHQGNDTVSTFFLQWLFLAIISLSAGMTVYSVRKTARSSSWEKNWRGEPAQRGYLDAEHGSVHDISSAVATPAEKLAEALPGLLLVIGLLGTFIGLGLALNNASSILQKVDGSGELADATKSLTGMMSGLGMKFKTSTWGIIGFLIMNVFNAVDGFEKRRLSWSVAKMRFEMDQSRQKRIDRDKEASRIIIAGMQGVGNQIILGLAKQDKLLQRIVEANEDSNKEIKAFLTTNTDNLRSMKESASKMSEAATKAGSAADALAAVVKDLDIGVKTVLLGVKRDLNLAITSLDQGLREKIADMANNLQTATGGIATAVGQLSTEVQRAMKNVRDSVSTSLDMQKVALVQFSSVVNSLEENVQKSTENLNNIGEEIKLGLNAVSNSGLKMVRLGEDIRGTLEEMKMLRTEALKFYESFLATFDVNNKPN